MPIFCPACHAYSPAASYCPFCGHAQTPLHIAQGPGEAPWRIAAPGSIAAQFALAELDGEALLLAGWASASGRERRTPDGGVSAYRLGDGSHVWTRSLGGPVLGGPVMAGNLVLAATTEMDGDGAVAAVDLASGEERWRATLPAGSRSVPAVYEGFIFIVASDGQLYCLRVVDGRQVGPPWPLEVFPGSNSPAAPVLQGSRERLQHIIVGTYGDRRGRQPGVIAAFDIFGRPSWRLDAEGYVRATPTLVGTRLYVAAYGYIDSSGALMAYDVADGKPLWQAPFWARRQAGERRGRHFSVAPLVHEGVVYVGSIDHTLYAVDARTGKLRWQVQIEHGITAAPVLLRGLIVFGDSAGQIHALDPAAQEIVWTYQQLGGRAMTTPLALDEHIVVGSDSGAVAALPWHLGRYAWAAARLQGQKQWDEAGDCWALAAHFADNRGDADRYTTQAVDAWQMARRNDKIGQFWQAHDRRIAAADAYQQAGEDLRLRDRASAVAMFALAADLNFLEQRQAELAVAARALATCADLPCIHLRAINAGRFVIHQPGHLTLRMHNDSRFAAPEGVTFWLGGALAQPVQAEIHEAMPAGQTWNIPLAVTATMEQSRLLVEYEYATGHPHYPLLRGMAEIAIEAAYPRQKIEIGDVQNLHITVAGQTAEGVAIHTKDVASMRSQGDIGALHIAGDAGALIARRGDIGSVAVGGDVAVVRGSGT